MIERPDIDRPNISDLPPEVLEIIREALKKGQTEMASEVIGNYLKGSDRDEKTDKKDQR